MTEVDGSQPNSLIIISIDERQFDGYIIFNKWLQGTY